MTRKAAAYNLAVEDLSTYYVVGGSDAVLVHNADPCPSVSNYRKNFITSHPEMPSNWQVHHAIPQKYEKLFKRLGVNVHDNYMLRGVDPKIHSQITTEWARWERSLGRAPTVDEVTQFSYVIDEKYGANFIFG
jgi:hypothetical protein